MMRIVEYRNLTFSSSKDGQLQIWFEARCDFPILFTRVDNFSRQLIFRKLTPQVMSGWAVYCLGSEEHMAEAAEVSLVPFRHAKFPNKGGEDAE